MLRMVWKKKTGDGEGKVKKKEKYNGSKKKKKKEKKSLTLHPSFPIVLALLSIKIEKLAWALYGPFSQRLAKKQKKYTR